MKSVLYVFTDEQVAFVQIALAGHLDDINTEII